MIISNPGRSSNSLESDSHFANKNPFHPSERGAVNNGKAPCKSGQSSGSNDIINKLRRIESVLNASIQEVSQRVDHLKGTLPVVAQTH